MAGKIGRKWLLSVFAVPVAFAGVATADPWLEKSPTVGQGWDDIPFLGPPQRPAKQRQPRSPETTRVLESKRELQRELHRLPETNRAANPKSTANVFPPPRMPQQARTAEPAPETSVVAQPVEARSVRPSELPHKPSRTAAVHTRDGEQELQRELNRTLPPTAVPPVGEPLACAERLAKIARYSPLPSRSGPGACGAVDLVRVDSIVMPDRTLVALNPAPQIKCSMAEQLAEWVREDVGPAASAELGSRLLSISDVDAYDCRPRNGIKGAPLSEHGKGNALDIAGLRLRNGGVFTLADQLVAKSFRDKVRLAACGRFMTVLGPGADPYHGDHVHLDMAERTHKFKICQWNVRETVVASRAEPESPQRAASSPPVAAVPVVPPPPKVESKIEPDPAAIAAAEEQVREEQAKQELARQEQTKQEQARQEQAKQEQARQEQAEQELARQEQAKQEQAKQEQAKQEQARQEQAEQELARQEQAKQEQARQEQAKQELARQEQAKQELARQEQAKQELARQERAKQKPPQKQDTPTFDVAAATPNEPETRQEQKEERSPPQTAETEQRSIPSPPLPRRKPEALQMLAQLPQSDGHSRAEPESRWERPRSYRYGSRHRFERDIRRFMRNFF